MTRSAQKIATVLLLGTLVLAISLFAARGHAADAPTPLIPAPIVKRLKLHKVPQSAVSFIVQAIGASAPIALLNPNEPRNPASSIKLLTTFVALDTLGPNYSWPTEFYAESSINDGVLDGDLFLKGYGDPYMTLEELWKLLGKLRQTGVRKITGDLVIDDTHFEIPPGNPGAFDQQPLRLYNVLPNAALINFKAFAFEFRPNRDGKSVDIIVDPPLENLQISNQLSQKNGRCRGYNRGIKMDLAGPDNDDHLIFSGQFPSGCRSYLLRRSAMMPSSYAFGAFKRIWSQWGGEIDGTVRKAQVPTGIKPLLVSYSRPLAEVIRPLNKWSNNVMSRLLLYSIGSTQFEPPIRKNHGIEVVFDYLQTHRIDTSGLVVDNGSGLSRTARVSAQSMTQLLQHAYRSPFMPEFIASMSINGIDGTTRRRFRGRPEAGRMHLKTGRLDGAAAIAGYVLAQSGTMYSVVLLANSPGIHHGPGIELQNALLAWVYSQ